MDVDSPLKRCSSAPIIANRNGGGIISTSSSNSSSSIANDGGGTSSAVRRPVVVTNNNEEHAVSTGQISSGTMNCDTPAPNIFSRTRRYSASSFSPLATAGTTTNSSNTMFSNNNGNSSPSPASSTSNSTPGPRLTPRVSQLRQEECADISNIREVNHERGLHNQLQISQSWEDLTIVTENLSCRDDIALTNPLLNCSSPSPTSSRSSYGHLNHHNIAAAATGATTTSGLRYPFSMSPSPTRKTFATRRSMSPNHVRPSQLCPVKRKFDMDESSGGGSPPPHKKMFLDVVARGSSPISHSLPICPSPDSGTYEGRTTPKLFISKLCSSNSLSSFSSSASASPTSQLEMLGEREVGNNSNHNNNVNTKLLMCGTGTTSGGNCSSSSNSSSSSSNGCNSCAPSTIPGGGAEGSGSGDTTKTIKEAKEETTNGKEESLEVDKDHVAVVDNGQLDDHHMLDLSGGDRVDGNCDKMTEGNENENSVESGEKRTAVKSMNSEVIECKEKVLEEGDRKLDEVDDGIGEEEGVVERTKVVLGDGKVLGVI